MSASQGRAEWGFRALLAESGSLFVSGLSSAFPWILAAELVQMFVPASASGDILHADLGQYFTPAHLSRAVLSGLLQAFCYGVAIIRMTQAAGGSVERPFRRSLLSAPALLVSCLIYDLILVVGMGLGLIFFLTFMMIFGPLPGVLASLIPLAPTAVASTALALFAYPVVLERTGPVAGLSRSVKLVLRNWARVTLVISVPALVLFAVWVAASGIPLFRTVGEQLRQVSDAASQMDQTQLEALLSAISTPQEAVPGPIHQGTFALLDALAWWYTVAVCYVEYRALASTETPH